MNRYQKCLGLGAAALILSGCTTYGDPTTYSHLECQSLRALYDPANNIGELPDVLASESDFNAPKPNKLTYANANLARNATAKRESDLRAAYRAKGC